MIKTNAHFFEEQTYQLPSHLALETQLALDSYGCGGSEVQAAHVLLVPT